MKISIRTTIAAAGLWLLLTAGSVESWVIGLPAVLAAGAVAGRRPPPEPLGIRPLGLARFALYFLVHSFIGAVDVALRSVAPRLPIQPGMIEYPLALQASPARMLLLGVVCLVPGTVSADLRGDVLVVHVLDAGQPVAAQLREVERRVAGVFGLPAAADDSLPPAETNR
jgi:multicomponent Na+:H+ antiporter subunit E